MLILFILCFGSTAFAHPALIPMPASVAWGDGKGKVPINPDTAVEARGGAETTGAYLSRALGLKRARRGNSRIRLSLVPPTKISNSEGYHLRAAGNSVLIEASDPRGLFYGAQTLIQLIEAKPGGVPAVAAADIDDAPRFRWR